MSLLKPFLEIPNKELFKGFLVFENIWQINDSTYCIITLNLRLGHRCGYIHFKLNDNISKVLYGLTIEDKNTPYFKELYPMLLEILNMEVHGGITYDLKYFREEKRFMLGFDTNHSSDSPDIESLKKHNVPNHIIESLQYNFDSHSVKDFYYLEKECISLSKQLENIFKKYQFLLKLLELED